VLSIDPYDQHGKFIHAVLSSTWMGHDPNGFTRINVTVCPVNDIARPINGMNVVASRYVYGSLDAYRWNIVSK
jgi:hypothetical protein